MDGLTVAGRLAVRWRYPLLATWAVPWFAVPYRRSGRGLGEWQYFEFGARTLVHFNRHYADGALHLYALHPNVQIGPPALWLVAAFQWAPPHAVALAFGLLMTAAALVSLAACEAAARRVAPAEHAHIAAAALLGGLVLVAAWAHGVGAYRHLDDVLALTSIALALAVVARGRPWWLAGLLVGLAVASKPWALTTAPLLLGLPRADRARCALVALGFAAVWWLPFVLGDTRTLTELGAYRLYVDSRSALHALGVHDAFAPDWVRPAQLVAGFAVAAVVAARGRWWGAPAAGIALRVLLDPQTWPYYGIGPVLTALVLDLVRGGRALPVWTAVTAVVEYGVPHLSSAAAGPVRVAWVAGLLAILIRPARG